MKKMFTLIVIALFITTAAFAEAPTNKAIGYDGMLDGISYRTMMGTMGIQGILGLGFDSPAGDTSDSALDLAIGVNLFKCLWESDKGQLNCFAGIAIDLDGSTMKDSDSVTDINLSVGLEPEIFLLDNLSVTTKFGLMISIQGDELGADGKTADDTGGLGVRTYGEGVSIIEGLSFNWYF